MWDVTPRQRSVGPSDGTQPFVPGKIALVHDALNQNGGAEKVLAEFHDMFPEAPVYCPVYRPEVLPPAFAEWDVRTSWMQRLPGARVYHRLGFALYPFAMHALDLTDY
ncbi:MAG TPA: hypothetical protein VGC09_19975, partial [Rhodopila sp.]